MKRSSSFLALAAAAACLASHSAGAAEWQNWRGPNQDGSSDAKGVPSTFSPTDNLRWSADMPGSAASTPIISGGKVFVSSTDEENKKLLALAYDLKTGKELWRHVVGNGLAQDNRSNFAGASPVTDGELVAFFFGTGDLWVVKTDGTPVWKTNIQKEYGNFYFLWTFSSSPIIVDDKLVLQVLQRDTPVHDFHGEGNHTSFLLGLELATGKEVFKVDRPDAAKAEAKEAFSTPVLHTHDGKSEILITGGDCITGHDPETGKELWRWGTWNPDKIGHWRLVPSPVAGAGIALACAPKKAPVYAVKLGGKGTLKDSDIAWVSSDKSVSSDVSTPLFYKGRFYVLHSDKKSIACVDPASGKVIWSEELDCRGKIEASPTAAEDKIYFISHHGEAFVVAAGDEFKQLHKTEMGPGRNGMVRSSVALADGTLLIRTDEKLFCIGK